jgi:hypothetical protein
LGIEFAAAVLPVPGLQLGGRGVEQDDGPVSPEQKEIHRLREPGVPLVVDESVQRGAVGDDDRDAAGTTTPPGGHRLGDYELAGEVECVDQRMQGVENTFQPVRHGLGAALCRGTDAGEAADGAAVGVPGDGDVATLPERAQQLLRLRRLARAVWTGEAQDDRSRTR